MICTICLEEIKKPLTQSQKMKRLSSGLCSNIREQNVENLLCNHFFHKECIKSWFKIKTTCPNCRTQNIYYKYKYLKLYYPY